MYRALSRPILLLSGAAMLSACAAGGAFPSLAPRAVEQDDAVAETPDVPAQGATEAVDPQLAARLAGLLADARRGQAAFEALLPSATSAVAGAGSAGSEAWIAAQLAVSRLEAGRAPSVVALADLDALAIAHAGTAALPAVMAARGEAQALAVAQQQRIEALQGRLSPL